MALNLHRKRADYPEDEGFSLRELTESVSGPIMFFLVIVAVIFVMSVFFRVSDIQVRGNSHYTDEEIIRAIDIEEGDNLFFFDRFAALSRVFAKLPYIDEVTVERSLPNRVVITVTESQALAYIVLGEENWTIDHNCKVLGKANDDELQGLIPILGISPGTLMIGETLETADGDEQIVEFIAEVLEQLEGRGLYTRVGRVDFTDPEQVEFTLGDKYTVRIGNSSAIDYKFGMLISVLSQLLEGDVGIINVSDGNTAHFSPT